MNPLILMAAIVAGPTLLIVVTKSKAAFVFMALCVGSVLASFVGDTALDMVQTFIRGYSPTTQSAIQIGLLVLPAFLTMLFLGRMLSGSKRILNIFPAILTGLMTLYLVVPLLPDGTKYSIYGTPAWSQLYEYQSILVAVAVGVSLVQLWASGSSARHKKGTHSKK